MLVVPRHIVRLACGLVMSFVVRIRGLPFSANADDIISFFNGISRGIYFPQGSNGRSNGEAFIELESRDDKQKAMTHHNEHLGRRYIEVFDSCSEELNNAMGCRPFNSPNRREHVVRLRGLPYDTEKKEIYAFFNGLEIAPNGIGLLVDHMGRCTGEAYVQFTSSERGYDAPPFSPNGSGSNRGPVPGRFTPYGRPPHVFGHPGYSSPPRGFEGPSPSKGSNFGPLGHYEYDDPQSLTGHSVRMRGLPYSATKEDINRFLSPLQPVNIRIKFNAANRPTGEAVVDFASHDEAKEAMKKDREKIGPRYIELFLNNNAPVPSRRSPVHSSRGHQGSQYVNFPPQQYEYDDINYAEDVGYTSGPSRHDFNQPYDSFHNSTNVRGPIRPSGKFSTFNHKYFSGDGYSDYRYRQGNHY
ncbi:unnamed protein product [Schistosoma margrebowiei]|uniref:RRM domain-containing protein n=1 Tax=Schistosoma margrebowiei TaxID=48269 RepID=A0A3P8G2T1_9TREM|nr:unnamed protein product [Schistosoma margrebowiei]